MTHALHLHSSIADIPEAEWNALLPHDAPPFLKHAFFRLLEETGCVGASVGWIPQLITLRQDARCDAALPLYIKLNSEGEFVYDHAWAELYARAGLDYYPKLIAATPFTPVTGQRVLARDDANAIEFQNVYLDALRATCSQDGFSSAHVLFPPEATTRALPEPWFVRTGIQFHFSNQGFSSFEDFLTTVPTKRRTQMRRERRAVRDAGIRIEVVETPRDHPELIDFAYRCYVSTYEKYPWGRPYLTLTFFHAVAEVFPQHFQLVVAKDASGRPIACAINFHSSSRLFGRYWGALADVPMLHFEVCYYQGIDWTIESGRQVFEPGAGGEHKAVRGFRPTKTFSLHHIENPRMRAILSSYVAREAAAIDRWIAESHS